MNDTVIRVPSPQDALLSSARTVTGNNLQGTVRILSAAEITLAMSNLQRGLTEAHAAELARLRAEFEGRIRQHEADLAALREQSARELGEARQGGEEQVAKIRGECDARVKKLEEMLAQDDVRQRLAQMEQEVTRLRALVDRYEAGLDFITSLETPDYAADIAQAEAVRGRVGPVLRERVDAIIGELRAAATGVPESLELINAQGRGSLYGVTDLMTRVVRVRGLHNELLSIAQVLDPA